MAFKIKVRKTESGKTYHANDLKVAEVTANAEGYHLNALSYEASFPTVDEAEAATRRNVRLFMHMYNFDCEFVDE